MKHKNIRSIFGGYKIQCSKPIVHRYRRLKKRIVAVFGQNVFLREMLKIGRECPHAIPISSFIVQFELSTVQCCQFFFFSSVISLAPVFIRTAVREISCSTVFYSWFVLRTKGEMEHSDFSGFRYFLDLWFST